jgi:hypothetical protein
LDTTISDDYAIAKDINPNDQYFDHPYDSPTGNVWTDLEYSIWSSMDAAGGNQSKRFTNFLKCWDHCIEDWDPANALGRTIGMIGTAGLTALGGPVPKSFLRWAFNMRVGYRGSAPPGRSPFTTIPSIISTRYKLAGEYPWIRALGKAANDAWNVYGVALFAIEAGCALHCACPAGNGGPAT